MARRRYLLTYDIRDERRLRAVANCVEAYGERVQYSVFICDLSNTELILLRSALEQVIKPSEDSITVVDLGSCDGTSRIMHLGQHQQLPDRSAFIV